MTEVVNINNGNPYDVYIGRAGKGLDGPFGNYVDEGQNRYERVAAFRQHFLNRVAEDEAFRQSIEGLRGKRLGCFCMPLLCHGNVIVEYLDGTSAEDQVARYVESYLRKPSKKLKKTSGLSEPDIFAEQ